jgi:phage gp36-like protein
MHVCTGVFGAFGGDSVGSEVIKKYRLDFESNVVRLVGHVCDIADYYFRVNNREAVEFE